jgi:hypothetical protein
LPNKTSTQRSIACVYGWRTSNVWEHSWVLFFHEEKNSTHSFHSRLSCIVDKFQIEICLLSQNPSTYSVWVPSISAFSSFDIKMMKSSSALLNLTNCLKLSLVALS